MEEMNKKNLEEKIEVKTIDFDALKAESGEPKDELDRLLAEKKREAETLIDVEKAFEQYKRKKEKVSIESLKLNEDTKTEKEIEINGVKIKVAYRLPLKEVIDGVQTVITLVVDDRGFISAPVKNIINDLMLLQKYSNLDIDVIAATGAPMRVFEMYQLLNEEGIIDEIKAAIDAKQLTFWENSLNDSLEGIINYQNSTRGLLDILRSKQNKENKDFDDLLSTLKQEENQELVGKLLNFMNSEMDNINGQEKDIK